MPILVGTLTTFQGDRLFDVFFQGLPLGGKSNPTLVILCTYDRVHGHCAVLGQEEFECGITDETGLSGERETQIRQNMKTYTMIMMIVLRAISKSITRT